jgi:hypothetical protein
MPSASESAKRIAIIAVACFVVANLAFYVLSTSYFESHRTFSTATQTMASTFTPAQITTVRMSFALFSAIVAIASVLAGVWTRAIGHAIPVVLGVLYLVAAVAAIRNGNVTTALPATLIITGGLMPVLAHFSFHQRSRGAWAFLVSICGVFAVVEFFGAPKVRGALDIGLWITMILPGLNAVAVAALVSLRAQYVDRSVRSDRAAPAARTAV